ncbi:putative protein (DUF3560 domain) [Campylobacter pinnipediorum subsp. caledonicus]|uniref:DUF3560 domain-containing protein n=1 Tax=Campylobacter pinnipediorum TaxID=1965231 RepID=UPI0009C20BC4|nr:DUF3560 domain-containing protein [Campylobacter pinnipediorum]AQW85579.1 putative protein (DUF3560 domain) [Campylobacter pinnipediorum subsp. caledonicus]
MRKKRSDYENYKKDFELNSKKGCSYQKYKIFVPRKDLTMNKFKKYCPNVFIAECDSEHQKGEIIELTSNYGKTSKHEVYNLIANKNGKFYYSIVRTDSESYAQKKANRYRKSEANLKDISKQSAINATKMLENVPMGQPIIVGSSKEAGHRALLKRSDNAMRKSWEEHEKAKDYEDKSRYWEEKAAEITLAMPYCLEYFLDELEKAKEYHQGLKTGKYEKEHSYTLTYANKRVKDLDKKVQVATILWG